MPKKRFSANRHRAMAKDSLSIALVQNIRQARPILASVGRSIELQPASDAAPMILYVNLHR